MAAESNAYPRFREFWRTTVGAMRLSPPFTLHTPQADSFPIKWIGSISDTIKEEILILLPSRGRFIMINNYIYL